MEPHKFTGSGRNSMLEKRILLLGSMVLGSMAQLAPTASGQTSNTVSGATYTLPSAIDAAPGQILNLMVQGVGASLTGRVAAPALPLPDVLAGISVKLVQARAPQSVAVPLL